MISAPMRAPTISAAQRDAERGKHLFPGGRGQRIHRKLIGPVAADAPDQTKCLGNHDPGRAVRARDVQQQVGGESDVLSVRAVPRDMDFAHLRLDSMPADLHAMRSRVGNASQGMRTRVRHTVMSRRRSPVVNANAVPPAMPEPQRGEQQQECGNAHGQQVDQILPL